MTLKELLETNTFKDERLYIGSRSAFLFIGSRKDALKKIPKISKKYYEDYKSLLKKLPEDIKFAHKIIDGYVERNSEILDLLKTDLPDKVIEKLRAEYERNDKIIDNRKHEIKRAEIRIEETKIILSKWVEMLDRKVIYTFKKDSMPDELGVAIKITGADKGPWWTYQEMIGKVKAEDDE